MKSKIGRWEVGLLLRMVREGLSEKVMFERARLAERARLR